MTAKKHRLEIGAEHHSEFSGSEVIRVDIHGSKYEYSLVVEHLASAKCIVIDFVYPNGERVRDRNIYYEQDRIE